MTGEIAPSTAEADALHRQAENPWDAKPWLRLSCALVGDVVPRLVQTRRVQVFVLVLELFLQFALFLGRFSGVLGRSGRVGVDGLIHRDLL